MTVDRRRALGFLALAPFAAAVPLRAGAAVTRAAPQGEYLLRRVLSRELSAGVELVVTRDWRCRFGFRSGMLEVSGEQVACTVEAPPSLAQLAEIERTRQVTGFLPTMLDTGGLIVTDGRGDDDSMDHVLAAAIRTLGEAAGGDERRYLAALAGTAAAAVSVVPDDLFYPRAMDETVSRQLPLGNGTVGELVVRLRAEREPASGLLVSSERRITTRASGLERSAGELWTLTGL